MLSHHIQRAIVQALSSAEGLRFSDLKPDDLDNKAFDYHLKLLIRDKLVRKDAEGRYELTPLGRKLSVTAAATVQERAERAFSVLFLVIKDARGWLLYRRKRHPLKDRVGFMHARPNAHESVFDTASRTVLEKTGLQCGFSYFGSGYFRTFDADELESFTHFTLLVADSVHGELLGNDDSAEYAWYETPDFSAEDMLPNMPALIAFLGGERGGFLEATYRL